jgi:septation ring formation regulator EzrA
MASKALPELIKAAFRDEKTKQEFRTNPERVLARYSLSEQEKRAVLAANTNLGLATSSSASVESTIEALDFWM